MRRDGAGLRVDAPYQRHAIAQPHLDFVVDSGRAVVGRGNLGYQVRDDFVVALDHRLQGQPSGGEKGHIRLAHGVGVAFHQDAAIGANQSSQPAGADERHQQADQDGGGLGLLSSGGHSLAQRSPYQFAAHALAGETQQVVGGQQFRLGGGGHSPSPGAVGLEGIILPAA